MDKDEMNNFLQYIADGKPVDNEQMNKFLQQYYDTRWEILRNRPPPNLDEVVIEPERMVELIKNTYKYVSPELLETLSGQILARKSIDTETLVQLGFKEKTAFNISQFVNTGKRICLSWE